MNTAFLLMAQYGAKAVVPIDLVCRDYFPHLSADKLVRKVSAGEIKIPLIRMESSQKCAKGVHLQDLADYLDIRRAAAQKECAQLASASLPLTAPRGSGANLFEDFLETQRRLAGLSYDGPEENQ